MGQPIGPGFLPGWVTRDQVAGQVGATGLLEPDGPEKMVTVWPGAEAAWAGEGGGVQQRTGPQGLGTGPYGGEGGPGRSRFLTQEETGGWCFLDFP